MLKLILERMALYMCAILVDGVMIHFVRAPQNKKNILLIRLDAIGDFFLWLNTAGIYRQFYPDSYITLLGNSVWAPFAERFPYWDCIWSVNMKRFNTNPFYRFKMLARIRRAGFKVAVQTVISRRVFQEDAVVFASAASERIGPSGDVTNTASVTMRLTNKFYTRLIQVSGKKIMMLQSNLDFIRGLAAADEKTLAPFCPSKKNNLPITPITNKLKDYYILFPGAGSVFRRWPASRFAELSDLIHQHYGLIGIIEGDQGDKASAQSILSASKNNQLIDMTGKSSLIELVEIIRHAKFLIGNETSGPHIAAYVNTPSICILGGGFFGKFVPYDKRFSKNRLLPIPVYNFMDCFGCNYRRPCNPVLKRSKVPPCISEITVDQAWKEVQNLLTYNLLTDI